MTTNTASSPALDTTPVVLPVRLDVEKLAPRIRDAMYAFSAAAAKVSLEQPLLELVRLRASQINGCMYCVDLHTKDARKAGETEQRLYLVTVWRESPVFTARERAALELTEAVTRLADHEVTDELFNRVAAHFTETELAELIWVITAINAWNRLGATARPWTLE
jgi:AhpD family alkylhydroperoxidase